MYLTKGNESLESLFTYWDVLSIIEQVFNKTPQTLDEAETFADEIITQMTDACFDN